MPKEMGTDTSALVGCSIGQVLHNVKRDFQSLPAGVSIFIKTFKYLLKKRGTSQGKTFTLELQELTFQFPY